MTGRAIGAWRAAQGLAGDVVRYRPRRLGALAAVTLANGALEAVSFSALVPLFGSLGLAANSAANEPAAAAAGLGDFARRLATGLSFEAALALFLLALLVRAALGYASAVLAADYVASYVDGWRRRGYDAFSRASWLYLTTIRPSRDLHAAMLLADKAGYAVSNLLMLASATTMAAAGVLVALLVSPALTLAVLASSALLSLAAVPLSASAWRRGEAQLEAMRGLYDTLTSRVAGLKLAKAFAAERALEQEFARASNAYRKAVLGVREDEARARLLQDWGAALTLSLLLFASVRVLAVPALELMLVVAICARLLPLVRSVRLLARSLVAQLPEWQSLASIVAAAEARGEPIAATSERLVLRDRVELSDVGFAYPGGSGANVLDGVSLRIAKGTVLAVIGHSGAGKSTLADIVCGLLVPDRGALLVDGVAITGAERAKWRNSVAYVAQDAPLVADSVRANLTLGLEAVEDGEIWRCLELVAAGDLVRALPGGLDATVGERGVQLSGGQRQRLRLASALLRRPQLLVLDEATNALSPHDESAIVPALGALAGETTILVIAHRDCSVAWAHSTFVLERAPGKNR